MAFLIFLKMLNTFILDTLAGKTAIKPMVFSLWWISVAFGTRIFNKSAQQCCKTNVFALFCVRDQMRLPRRICKMIVFSSPAVGFSLFEIKNAKNTTKTKQNCSFLQFFLENIMVFHCFCVFYNKTNGFSSFLSENTIKPMVFQYFYMKTQ